MKNNKILQIISVGFFCLLALPTISAAAEFRYAEQVSVPAGEVVASDLYMSGGSVINSGATNGDLVTAGGTLLLNGAVMQDLTAAGGNITITGDTGDDLRVAGGNILVQGNVAGDAVIAGGQVFVTGKNIGGDLVVAGGAVHIDSAVFGNTQIFATEVYLNAPVGKDVKIFAEKVTLGPKANIVGNLNYTADQELKMEDGAVVQGKVDFQKNESSVSDMKEVASAGLLAFLTFWLIAKFLMIFICALVVGYLLTRYSKKVVEESVANPVQQIGRGLIILIVMPVASIILLFTIVGMPFGFLGLLGYVIILIFTSILAPILIGSVVKKWISKTDKYEIDWKTILLGTVIYFVLGIIPLVGWVVEFGVMLILMGVMFTIKSAVIKDWR